MLGVPTDHLHGQLRRPLARAGDDPAHVGLRGMRARLEEVGGDVLVEMIRRIDAAGGDLEKVK